MCGIVGIYSQQGKVNKNLVSDMLQSLIHRGPDDQGIFISGDGSLILGHCRLSIIDLSKKGHQPMSNEDRTIWIVYNGEIYNFKEIRSELEGKEHIFQSNTDTEIIIHAYEEWGVKCLKKFNGMFAFGLYDEKNQILFLARDRIGKKPLYYHNENGKFLFASEIKAIIKDPHIRREINRNALADFLKYRYIPTPRTIWNDISKLPPGSFLIYDLKTGKIKVERYWSLSIDPKQKESNENEDIKNLLEKSVQSRLISDVPLGVLLSGGLDSSLITALIKKSLDNDVSSFTVGFKDNLGKISKNDEVEDAKFVAGHLKISHEYSRLEHKDWKPILNDIVKVFDEPLGDSSIIPTSMVMQAASQKLKVVLGGDGGDELFAGYVWHTRYMHLRRLGNLMPKSVIKILMRLFSLLFFKFGIKTMEKPLLALEALGNMKENPSEAYRTVMGRFFDDPEIRSLLGDSVKTRDLFAEYLYDPDDIKALQYLDFNTYLPEDILVKVDRTSMANSLEVRAPFLDYNLIEYVFSLPSAKILNGGKKGLIKKIAAEFLPQQTINKKKQGFGSPIKDWNLENDLSIKKSIMTGKAVSEGILNKDAVERFFEKPALRKSNKIWLLYLFELWYREWFK